ncbi:MAG: RluA family pseudouridine synthase, partial [Oscillospiraceae bacterium]|nr:RluA family pseudouridine synthase [Oscillospiraceae bacterium]
MEPEILQAGAEAAGERLDSFLAKSLPELTRSAAQRLIEGGRVAVDGRPAAKSCRLSGGEAVSVILPEPEPLDAAPQAIALDVVYEDGDVIVVNKPVGMVVHPAPGHPDGTLVNALLYHCGRSLSGVGGALRPGIVHRIDRDTGGLIIAAKNDAAHLALSSQLQDHTLARTYEALVTGNLREDRGTVDAPIGRHHTDRK